MAAVCDTSLILRNASAKDAPAPASPAGVFAFWAARNNASSDSGHQPLTGRHTASSAAKTRNWPDFIMSTARSFAIIQRGLVVREFQEDEGLEVKPETLLYAFDLMRPYATGRSNTLKLENNKELALGLVDWALMEGDRGLELLRLHEQLTLKRSQSGPWS